MPGLSRGEFAGSNRGDIAYSSTDRFPITCCNCAEIIHEDHFTIIDRPPPPLSKTHGENVNILNNEYRQNWLIADLAIEAGARAGDLRRACVHNGRVCWQRTYSGWYDDQGKLQYLGQNMAQLHPPRLHHWSTAVAHGLAVWASLENYHQWFYIWRRGVWGDIC